MVTFKTKKFYYSIDDQEVGPLSFSELELADISLDTTVWFEGLKNWQRLGDIPELVDLLANKTGENRVKNFRASDPEIFQHPDDINAMREIQKLKGIDQIVEKITELEVDKLQFMKQVTSSFLVTENQLPDIYEILVSTSKALDMSPPRLFIEDRESLYSLALGIKEPFIVLSNSLVETFDEKELSFIIGHELGHHKCQHILNTTLLSVIMDLGDFLSQKGLGVASLAITGVHAALSFWYRKSVLSSDRAGLIASRDIDSSIAAVAKISGIPKSHHEDFNTEEFIKQAELYEEIDGNLLNTYHKIQFMSENILNNHQPLPALRARELYDWSKSKEFEDIMSGNFNDVEKKHLYVPSTEEEVSDKREPSDFASEAKGIAEDAAKGIKSFFEKL